MVIKKEAEKRTTKLKLLDLNAVFVNWKGFFKAQYVPLRNCKPVELKEDYVIQIYFGISSLVSPFIKRDVHENYFRMSNRLLHLMG